MSMTQSFTKKFHLYHTQDFAHIEQAIIMLSDLNNKGYFESENERTVWYCLERVVGEIKEKDTSHPDWLVKQAVIGMVDEGLLKEMYDLTKELFLTRQIFGGTPTATAAPAPALVASATVSAAPARRTNLELVTAYDPQWRAYFNAQDESNQRKIDESVIKFLEARDELFGQLETVCAFLRAVPGMKLYEPKEMIDIISTNRVDFDHLQFMYTLREAFHDKYSREVIRAIITSLALDKNRFTATYTWYDAALFTIYLHLVYSAFNLYTLPMRKVLLSGYFYHAVVAGVPVRKALESFLYETQEPIQYIDRNMFLFNVISRSVEMIPMQTAEEVKEGKSLMEISKNFMSRVAGSGGKFTSAQMAQEIYGSQDNHAIFEKWLNETLSIWGALKEGALIEQNSGGEITEGIRFGKDMENLVLWYIAKTTWPNIAEYYKQEDPFVPLRIFIRQFVGVADLNREDVAQKFLDFTDFLHQANVLDKNAEIIEFHENDGKFYWSEYIGY